MATINALDQVDTRHPAYSMMADRWRPIDALLSGTQRMRDLARTTQSALDSYLPMEPKEPRDQYERRVARSFLYGMLGDTIKQLVSKPFARSMAIQPEQNLPWLDALLRDADGSGRSLHNLIRDAMKDGIAHGSTHLLVDAPPMRGDENNGEFAEKGVRPFIIHVRAESLIGWRVRKLASGSEDLAQIRILERRYEDEGAFGVAEVEYVRVFDAPGVEPDPIVAAMATNGKPGMGYWSLWKRGPGRGADEWTIKEAGRYSAPKIPLVSWIFGERCGPMLAMPPLEELAWVNIAHWQRFSDYMTSVRFASVAHLFMAGVTGDERKKIQDGGAAWSRLIGADNPNASLTMIESTGAAIGALETCLASLEERAEVLGLRPQIERTSSNTATGASINQRNSLTILQSWIQDGETVTRDALALCHEIMGAKVPEDLAVDIFSDFDAGSGAPHLLTALVAARVNGDLTRETFIRELRRLGGVSEDVDPETEAEAAGRETPILSKPSEGNPFFGSDETKPGDEAEPDDESGDDE
jgi:hypothetical protein